MKIDEKFYTAGTQAYKDGMSLRDVVEKVTELEDLQKHDESKSESFALGFCESILTAIRKATAN